MVQKFFAFESATMVVFWATSIISIILKMMQIVTDVWVTKVSIIATHMAAPPIPPTPPPPPPVTIPDPPRPSSEYNEDTSRRMGPRRLHP